MRVALIDLETSGDQPPEDVPIEIAIIYMNDRKFDSQYTTLIHPGDRPISPVASACHHLTTKIIKEQVHVSQLSRSAWDLLLGDCDYLVAHNAAFDRAFIPDLDIPWICTYRVAKHVLTDAPKFGLQTLRYWLHLDVSLNGCLYPHRALYDTKVLAELYLYLRKSFTDEELAYMTSQPVLMATCSFGKHRGTPWSDVPRDYLEWICKNEFDEDTAYTARYYLAQG